MHAWLAAAGHVVTRQPGGSSTAQDTFHISSISPALLYLKPQQPTLHFVQAMMDGLATGHHAESALLNNLLLPPWHVHISPDANVIPTHTHDVTTSTTHLATSTTISGSGVGEASMPSLQMPVTVGVLPPNLFTSSHVVFTAAGGPRAWLKQHQPVAVQLLPAADRAAQVQSVLEWLEADIQEVIQTLGQQQVEAGPHAAAAAQAEAGGGGATSSGSGLGSDAGTTLGAASGAGTDAAALKVAGDSSQIQSQQQHKQHDQGSSTEGTPAASDSQTADTGSSSSSSSSSGTPQAAAEGGRQQQDLLRPQGRPVPAAAAAAVPVPVVAVSQAPAAAPAKQAAAGPALAPAGSTQQMQARGSKLASRRAVSKFGYRRTNFATSAQPQTQKDQDKQQQVVPAAPQTQGTQGAKQQQQQQEPTQQSAKKKHRKHVHYRS
jgi:hypothetical protein